jgi:ABC-type multidrug transport system fused ATPase/permease subunit
MNSIPRTSIVPVSETEFPFWATLYRYFQSSKGLLSIALLFNLIAGCAITAQNALPKYFIDDILLAHLLPAEKVRATLLIMLAYLGVCIGGRIFFWHMSMRIFSRASTQALTQIRTRFFNHVNFLCLRFHQHKPSGELLSYLFGGPIAGLQLFLSQFFLSVPYAVFTLVGTLVLVFSWNGILASVLLFGLLINASIVGAATRRVRLLHHSLQSLESSVAGRTSELLRGQKAVKMLGAEESVIERFRNDAEAVGQSNYQVLVQSHLQGIKSEIIQLVIYAAMAVTGTWLYVQGKVAVGEVVAALGACASLQPMVGLLFQCALNKGVAHAGLNRIESILAHRSSTPQPDDPQTHVPSYPSIDMEDVKFAYEEKPVLRGVTLHVPFGQKVALVGQSGSGKSTLISLLLRLYDPDEGLIRIGGVDLRQLSLQTVRRQFAVVPQETFLFNASVKENVEIALPEASEAQIVEALKKANAWDFVQKLPHGMETVLGESGANLSGGQRQRLGIARALLQDPPCYIFDEATSALDATSESIITETLSDSLKNNTVFIIAHRFSTIAFCDRVVVFDQGEVVQDGAYAELAKVPGPFRKLLETGSGAIGQEPAKT